MLEGLTRELKPGDTLSFVLSLEGYGNFATEAEVRPAEVTPAP
jgi:hypothetical protein